MSRARVHGALVLAALTLLFAARVAGQALVAFLDVTWLPPMDRWYSGLLPYPVLLPVQVAILATQVMVDAAVWRGRAFAARPHPRAARGLRRLSYVYALAMLARYIVTGSHLIPVVFHWVLAAYLFTLALTMSQGATAPPGRPE